VAAIPSDGAKNNGNGDVDSRLSGPHSSRRCRRVSSTEYQRQLLPGGRRHEVRRGREGRARLGRGGGGGVVVREREK